MAVCLPNLVALVLGGDGCRKQTPLPTAAPLDDLAAEFPDPFAKILRAAANGDPVDACKLAAVFVSMLSHSTTFAMKSNDELWWALTRYVFGNYNGSQRAINDLYGVPPERPTVRAGEASTTPGRSSGKIAFDRLCKNCHITRKKWDVAEPS